MGIVMWFICYPDVSGVEHLPFYTYSVGMHIWQYPTPREQGYAFGQFLYSDKGKGRLITEGKTVIVPEKSVIYLPPDTPHYYEAVTDVWNVRWFVPAGEQALPLLKSLGFDRCRIFPIQDLKALDDLHNKIHMAFQINTEDSIFYSASYTYEFIFEFYRQYMQCDRGPAVPYRRRLTPLIEYIEHHFDEQITQTEMCEKLGVSPQHLCRMFKACMGTRPMEYVCSTRIRHACDLLTQTTLPVTQICLQTGFNNVNYFCREFKKYTGMTPSQYRHKV